MSNFTNLKIGLLKIDLMKIWVWVVNPRRKLPTNVSGKHRKLPILTMIIIRMKIRKLVTLIVWQTKMRLKRKRKRPVQKERLVQRKKVCLVVLKKTFSIHSLKKLEKVKELVITILVPLEILLQKSRTSNRITDLERLKEAEDLVKTLFQELTINPS